MAEAYTANPTDTAPGEQPSSYKRWCSRVERMRKLRKDWAQKWKVERCEEFYLGDQRKGVDDGRRVLNHFLSTVRVTQPNLLFENPKFIVRPKPGRAVQVSNREASVAEGVLTSVAQQDDNLENASALALLQNFTRIGVLKVVYDPKLEVNPNADMPVYERDENNEVVMSPAAPQMDEMGNPVVDPMSGMPAMSQPQPQPMLDPATGQPIMEPQFIVSDEAYRFEWVDARNMLLPDEGPDMSKWPWIGEEIVVTLEEAKEDERFPAELRAIFKSNCSRKGGDDDKEKAAEKSYGPDDILFKYCELYDIRRKRRIILAEGQDFDELLLDEPTPEGVEDHPYAILPGWIPIVGPEPSPWPLPYTYPWLDPQDEYNIRRNQMMEGAKRSARKVYYDEGTFDDPDEATKALQSSRDMEGIKVRDVTRIPVVQPDPPLPATIFQDVPALLNDWRIITGQTGASLGAPDADTATEAQFVERASQLRDVELQKAVAKWQKVAGKKMLQLIKATLTLEMFIKMRSMNDSEVENYLFMQYGIDPMMMAQFPAIKDAIIHQFGQEKLVKVTREELQFEADVEVVPGSTRPRTLKAEKAEFLELLQLIAQAPQLALSRGLLEEIKAKYDFISDRTIEELHALAMTMMQVNSQVAGRGGQNTSPENSEGQGPSAADQAKSDVMQYGV